MAIRSQKDFASGIMFTAVGLAFALGSTSYTVGNAARMGPGYFPLLLGVLLALLGLGVTASSLGPNRDEHEDVGRFAWKPLLFVIAANLLFGLLLVGIPALRIPAFGLIVAVFVLVIVASMAGEKFSLKASLILAAILALGSYLAFVVLLRLTFPVWPSFITG